MAAAAAAAGVAPSSAAIPADLYATIIDYLAPKELSAAAVVCRRWRVLCGKEALWSRSLEVVRANRLSAFLTPNHAISMQIFQPTSAFVPESVEEAHKFKLIPK